MKVILGIISIFLFAFVLTGCKNNTTTSTAKNTNTTSGTELVDDSEQYKIYKIASSSGYTGTYEEWLESIKGDSITLQVNDGYIEWKYSKDTTWTKLISLSSLKGDKGETGKSAYQIYCDNYPSYTKTEVEWLDDLINERLGTIQTHAVIFATNSSTIIDNQTIEHLNKVTKPIDPVKTGYTFLGWYDSYDELWIFGGCIVTEDMTLTAKWQTNTYTVTLDANGGTYEGDSSFTVQFDSSLVLPTPTKDGYIFLGWKDSENNAVNINSFSYDSNQTLTASYGPLFTITFDTNGGSDCEIYEGHSTTVSSLPTVSLDNATFKGWFYNGTQLTVPFEYTYSFDITLTAAWTTSNDEFNYYICEEVKITSYLGSVTNLVIPNKINNKDVTSIDASAFSGCTSLISITIPDSVTSIGDNAFQDRHSASIYCEASSQPSGVSSFWNTLGRPVTWGYTG